MEFIKAMEIKRRICEQTSCMGCILNEKKGITCNQLMELYPQQAEKILIEWDKEHPIKTNVEEFCEHFGIAKENVIVGNYGIFLTSNNQEYPACDFDDFWEKEYRGNEQT